MDYTAFKERFNIELNKQQVEAVQAVEGSVLLLAVPGSGKTTVLVDRLGYMIFGCGIAPENILTITYTDNTFEQIKFNNVDVGSQWLNFILVTSSLTSALRNLK